MHGLADVLNHPAAILFMGVCLALFFLKYQGLTYQDFISTSNTISPQTLAILVLIVGFWMLLDCKTYGIDTTVAGGVIGCGINMLTGKNTPHDPASLPPGSVVKEASQVQTPPITADTPLPKQ